MTQQGLPISASRLRTAGGGRRRAARLAGRLVCWHCVACYAVVLSYAVLGSYMEGRVPRASRRDVGQVAFAPVWVPAVVVDATINGTQLTRLYPPSGLQYLHPWGVYLLVAGPPVVILGWRDRRRRRRADAGCCPECGYDLRASDGRCPECGRLFARPAVGG